MGRIYNMNGWEFHIDLSIFCSIRMTTYRGAGVNEHLVILYRYIDENTLKYYSKDVY